MSLFPSRTRRKVAPDKQSHRAIGPVPPQPRAHLRVEVPEEVLERLSQEQGRGSPLLRLTLAGTTAGFPFLTELYHRHGVKCRILKVWLEYDERGGQYGQLLTELADASGLLRARSFLDRLGIGVELLGYVSPLP